MACGGAIKTRMHLCHPTLPVDEESGREGQEGIQRGQGSGNSCFVSDATEQLIVADVVTIAHAQKDLPHKCAIRLPFILQ